MDFIIHLPLPSFTREVIIPKYSLCQRLQHPFPWYHTHCRPFTQPFLSHEVICFLLVRVLSSPRWCSHARVLQIMRWQRGEGYCSRWFVFDEQILIKNIAIRAGERALHLRWSLLFNEWNGELSKLWLLKPYDYLLSLLKRIVALFLLERTIHTLYLLYFNIF